MAEKPRDASTTKKPYQTPRLIVHGDIRRLTLNIARNTLRDGGPNNQRT